MNKLKLLSVISVLSLLFFAAPALASANMLVNGGFEIPDVPSGWAIYPDGTAGLGWAVEWYGGSTNFSGYTRPAPQLELHNSGVIAGVNAPEGGQYAELDTDWGVANNEPASVKISQAVNTCTTGEYELSFYLRKRTADDSVEVTWDGTPLVLNTVPTITGWTQYTFSGLAASTASTILAITETGTPNSLGMFIDDVVLTQTKDCGPEPIRACTLTQGYWKNHADPDSNKYDPTWDYAPDSEYGWFNVGTLMTPVKGNAWYQLAHQYIAAKLNALAGALVPTEVQNAMTYAEDNLTADNMSELAKKGKEKNKVLHAEFVQYASVLADYNEGKIGPGHCEE